MKVAILGVGKLGLCFALNLERAGHHVLGVDVSEAYVASINNKTFHSYEPGVNELLAASKKFKATTDIAEIAADDFDIVFLMVATPSLPDGSYNHEQIERVAAALTALGKRNTETHLVTGCTVMPGYSDVLQKQLAPYNYTVSYNPEFIAQGNIIHDQLYPDQILIGEANTEIGDKLEELYKSLCKSNPQICRMSRLSAEVCKIATNCFLTTKISFANSIGDLAVKVGAEPGKILQAIGADSRIGNKYLKYGDGFGGPCFPRDNRALNLFAKQNNYPLLISEATDAVNKSHLQFQYQQMVNSGVDVYVFDEVVYKPGTVILEESQKLALAVQLATNGGKVLIKEKQIVIDELKQKYGSLFEYELKKMSHLPAIVVPCYNRAFSLKRLLNSLAVATYPVAKNVPLILSVDLCDDNPGSAIINLPDDSEVSALCEQFEWPHGEKIIIKHSTHLGLKQHILKCGDLTEQYGSVIILEDDLLVSPWFYEYAISASTFYQNKPSIAGVALYSYRYTENYFHPFYPMADGSDVYFMQLPCSWGQMFTAAQWSAFKKWLAENPVVDKDKVPAAIFEWGDKSWKKHFTHYLAATQQYFVYPRFSYTTNFGEVGANTDRRGVFQVPLMDAGVELKFIDLAASGAVYDASFEILPDVLNRKTNAFEKYSFTVDTYGTKSLDAIDTSYLLSSKQCSNPVVSFGNDLVSALDNVLYSSEGSFYSFGKKEDFTEQKQERAAYYPEMDAIKDIVFDTYVNERIAIEKYKLAFPLYHIIINCENEPKNIIKTLSAIGAQQYPHVKISVLINSPASWVALDYNVEFVKYNDSVDFSAKLLSVLNESDGVYFCLLKAGDTFYPKTFESINVILKRYPEIFWMTGIETAKAPQGFGTITDNIAFRRWNRASYIKRRLKTGHSGIPTSATFWTRDAWESVSDSLRFISNENPGDDIWSVFFEKHLLYTTVLYISSAAPVKNVAPPNILLEEKAADAFWEFCFRKNIPYLRSVYKRRLQLTPVIRYDYNSSTFYFSEY